MGWGQAHSSGWDFRSSTISSPYRPQWFPQGVPSATARLQLPRLCGLVWLEMCLFYWCCALCTPDSLA